MSVKRERGSRGLCVPSAKKYNSSLDFESMKYWDMALRAPRTKDFYIRNLATFLDCASDLVFDSPDDLLNLSDADAVDLIRKFSHKY
jgi:hypothetical protein